MWTTLRRRLSRRPSDGPRRVPRSRTIVTLHSAMGPTPSVEDSITLIRYIEKVSGRTLLERPQS
jgi:hypothetical protein